MHEVVFYAASLSPSQAVLAVMAGFAAGRIYGDWLMGKIGGL